MKKIIIAIAVIMVMLSMVSCKERRSLTEEEIRGIKYINPHLPNKEEILEENRIFENILVEDIIYEDIIEESDDPWISDEYREELEYNSQRNNF